MTIWRKEKGLKLGHGDKGYTHGRSLAPLEPDAKEIVPGLYRTSSLMGVLYLRLFELIGFCIMDCCRSALPNFYAAWW
jgi:hypothetical protein